MRSTDVNSKIVNLNQVKKRLALTCRLPSAGTIWKSNVKLSFRRKKEKKEVWSHKPPNTHCLLTFTNRPCIFIRALVICGNFFTSIIIIIVIITNSNSSKWQPQECIKSRRCNNGRTSLEKKLPTAVIIMNQWKISRTCKCNNFAINRTRIMSGNCYVPVTLPLSVLCC